MQWKAATVIFYLSCQSYLYVWDTYFKGNKHTMAPIPLTFIPFRAISHPNNLKERTTFLQFLWCLHKITDFGWTVKLIPTLDPQPIVRTHNDKNSTSDDRWSKTQICHKFVANCKLGFCYANAQFSPCLFRKWTRRRSPFFVIIPKMTFICLIIVENVDL